MRQTIWKAALKQTDLQTIEVPAGAKMLCARELFDDICVWYLCDPGASIERRTLAIVGTGHPTPDDGRYLGTASLLGGRLIFHVFERVQ